MAKRKVFKSRINLAAGAREKMIALLNPAACGHLRPVQSNQAGALERQGRAVLSTP